MTDFHDAVLLGIEVVIKDGIVALRLSDSGGLREIKLTGLIDIYLSNISPWGASNSVLDLSAETVGDIVVLTVNLQSGDVIRIHGRQVSGI
ncbi:hypothetical protein L5876_01405 [Hyphobacterium sp. SN044]|uniref:hypothetical protein n=1 Tax=Hyphobacterium sp. SN044 TaxID=2912575 RepID=UPI001F2BCD59|nr:hypothetical protein [Hyphobacterium sp. SN044]MCF8878469.1 hypothetical protein [Hyphobacterium sp. SN044]